MYRQSIGFDDGEGLLKQPLYYATKKDIVGYKKEEMKKVDKKTDVLKPDKGQFSVNKKYVFNILDKKKRVKKQVRQSKDVGITSKDRQHLMTQEISNLPEPEPVDMDGLEQGR